LYFFNILIQSAGRRLAKNRIFFIFSKNSVFNFIFFIFYSENNIIFLKIEKLKKNLFL
jgi:hypothetical protein